MKIEIFRSKKDQKNRRTQMRSHSHPKIFLFLTSKNKNSTHRMIKPKTAFIFSAVVFIALNKLKILAIKKNIHCQVHS